MKSRKFFNLSDEVKDRCQAVPPLSHLGYYKVEKEKVRGQSSSKENFDFGASNNACQSKWPDVELGPEFQSCMMDLHKVR